MSRELIEKMARAIHAESDIWRLAWDELFDSARDDFRTQARAILSLLSDPANITPEMVTAACESRAKDDEGEFPALADLIDFSGENKTHTVVRTAIAAAFSERAPSDLTKEPKP